VFSLTCDIFNACIIPCFWLYPFVYKSIAGETKMPFRVILASLVSCFLSLQLLSFFSIIEAILMHKANASFADMIIQFQLPYFITGFIEAAVTSAVLIFVKTKNPEFYSATSHGKRLDSRVPVKALVIALAVLISIASGSAVVTRFSPDQGDDTVVELLSGTAEATSGGVSSNSVATIKTPAGGRSGKNISQKKGSSYDGGSSSGRKAASIITIIIVIIFVMIVLFAKKREDKDTK
jgi:hypothetical protein